MGQMYLENDEPELRWGIIGCASIVHSTMIQAVAGAKRATLQAIASRSLEKAERAAAEYGIPRAYGSYEELLDDDTVDIVYIPLPNPLHAEWTVRAAQAGKHVLVEKPFAMTVEEAVRMVEAGLRHRVRITEGLMYRYPPRYEKLRETLRSGAIGDLQAMHIDFTFSARQIGWHDNIRLSSATGGGGLYDVGIPSS